MNKALSINGGILFLGGLIVSFVLTQVDPAALSESIFPFIFLTMSTGSVVYSLMVYAFFFGGELVKGAGKLGMSYFWICVRRSLFVVAILFGYMALYWLDMLTWIELVSLLLFFGFLELFISFQKP